MDGTQLVQLDIEQGTQREIDRRKMAALERVRSLLPRGANSILWLIYRMTKPHPELRVTYDWLAAELSMSRSTVIRHAKPLVDSGLLAKERTRDGWIQTGNEYRIVWDEVIEAGTDGRLNTIICVDDQSSARPAELAGTDIANSSNLTLRRVSNWNPPECQNGTQEGVKLEPLSVCINSSLIPSSSSPTLPPNVSSVADDEESIGWKRVMRELEIYGIQDSGTIRRTITAAQAKGITPQTVSELIRHAAQRVIDLDSDGKPIRQWVMPPADALDGYRSPNLRLWFWEPGYLAYRIQQHGTGTRTTIAEGWMFEPKATSERYRDAQRKLAELQRRQRRHHPVKALPDETRQAENLALRREAERLEAEFGERVAALDLEAARDLLPSFHATTARRTGDDPRQPKSMFYLTLLRAFAAKENQKTEANHGEEN